MVPHPLIITIDGPSGTGKSTAARTLAKKLGYLYLDTGAMYRAFALKALRKGVDLKDGKALARLAGRTEVSFRIDPGRTMKVLLDKEDVTREIRSPGVSEAASLAAAVPGVRRALVRQQQRIGSKGRVVAEGRDTGTVVFPGAQLKFYLTASVEERARRRWKELRQNGHPVDLKEVMADIKRRDSRDRNRQASPLKVAKGAVRIDNTLLKSTQVIGKMLDYVHKIGKRGPGQ
ncbi:MAG: (d)CMP kinase [Candidatus Omnitrophica bacterium]|nr:(d)CMP kinase [Candidatus Omnitrophota bacterium]